MADWREKSVSLNEVKSEEFDTHLAHITVSESRIHVEFKDREDWKRIKREVGEDAILKEVRWDGVEEVETKVEHLYYPHIDVTFEEADGEEVTKRLYFTEDEAETLESCLAAIRKFWNAARQNAPHPRDAESYSYQEGEEPDEEVDLEEAVAEEQAEEDAAGEDGDREGGAEDGSEDGPDTGEGDEEDEKSDGDDRSVTDVVEDFLPD